MDTFTRLYQYKDLLSLYAAIRNSENSTDLNEFKKFLQEKKSSGKEEKQNNSLITHVSNRLRLIATQDELKVP